MKEKVFKYIKKYSVIISLIISWLFIYGVLRYVFLYHDDYGNASLSYKYIVEGVTGTNYNFGQLLKWQQYMYLNFSGRVIWSNILILLIKNGPELYTLLESIVIVLVFLYLYKFASYKNKNWFSFLLPILFVVLYYQQQLVFTLREGVFWPSASILYVWPILPLTMQIYYQNKFIEEKTFKKHPVLTTTIISFLGLITAISQEQFSIASIVVIIVYFVFSFKDNIKDKQYLIYVIVPAVITILGMLFILLAPGSQVRGDTFDKEFMDLSPFEKIFINIPAIYNDIFVWNKPLGDLLKLMEVLMMLIVLFKNENKIIRYISLGLLTLSIFELTCASIYEHFMFLAIVLFLIRQVAIMIIFGLTIKSNLFIALAGAMYSSTYALVFSPVVGHRTSIIFIFLLFAIIGTIFNYIFNTFKSKNFKFSDEKINESMKYLSYGIKALIFTSFIVVGSASYSNYIDLRNNYRTNYIVESANRDSIILNKDKDYAYAYIINNEYRGIEPYDTNSYYKYIENYLREYYDTNPDLEFRWIAEYGYADKDNLYNENAPLGLSSIYGVYPFDESKQSFDAIGTFVFATKGDYKVSIYNPLNYTAELEVIINLKHYLHYVIPAYSSVDINIPKEYLEFEINHIDNRILNEQRFIREDGTDATVVVSLTK